MMLMMMMMMMMMTTFIYIYDLIKQTFAKVVGIGWNWRLSGESFCEDITKEKCKLPKSAKENGESSSEN